MNTIYQNFVKEIKYNVYKHIINVNNSIFITIIWMWARDFTLERSNVVFSAGKQQNHIFKLLQDEVIDNLRCDPHDLRCVHECGQLRVSTQFTYRWTIWTTQIIFTTRLFGRFIQNLVQNTIRAWKSGSFWKRFENFTWKL